MTSSSYSSNQNTPIKPVLTKNLVMFFAFCCGAIVSNIYYSQPLIELIAPEIGLTDSVASLIVSLTQAGYALGMLLLVPLGDLLENRKLMVSTLIVAMVSLVGAATAHSPNVFLLFSILIGFSSVSVQMIVPLAAHMADESTRGRVVGSVMSGLLFGILLSRPIASLIADHFGWRAVFLMASVLMVLIVVLLLVTMPKRQPAHSATYFQLLRSLLTLFRHQPVLRQRAFYQASMFGSMALFWTVAPVELARHFSFSQTQIALFALVGAAGAFAAPFAGRLADAGHGRIGSLMAMIGAILSFWPSLMIPALGVIGLGITAVLLDLCVQISMVIGQREVYALDPASRSRINSIYMTCIFAGGATGSGIGSSLYVNGGWMWVGTVGSLIASIALMKFLFDQRKSRS